MSQVTQEEVSSMFCNLNADRASSGIPNKLIELANKQFAVPNYQLNKINVLKYFLYRKLNDKSNVPLVLQNILYANFTTTHADIINNTRYFSGDNYLYIRTNYGVSQLDILLPKCRKKFL